MEYCRSKCGYFYEIIGDEKMRISVGEYGMEYEKSAMKGGTIQIYKYTKK